ncbi:uncharacterized protein PAC_19500 [Phialocephala subalpina]|uniref:Amino acid permease/ SLC12A domain-containing protein n=1 Tax=Phialocephala subalpina TaxID=576137 RepID=A0A1L7XX74_9HELO|nr:uncharacterized protein PAC_19500 [Phialocephala subalpina]
MLLARPLVLGARRQVTGVSSDTKSGEVVDISESDNRNGEDNLGKYRRTFLSRHIQIVTLGSNIGSGIFISTGIALRNGGPANMIVGYTLVMTMVIAVLQALTEMTVAFPVSGNIVDYADRFVDPALAFGVGFGEWLAWTTVLAAEGAAFNVIVQYWTSAVPVAAWMTICLIITFIIHAMPDRVFAEVYIAMVAGAGPTGKKHDGEYWRELPVFLHNVKGTSLCAIYAIWGVEDQVFVGIMGVKQRILATSWRMMRDCPAAVAASIRHLSSLPSMIDTGIKVIPDILNAAILISIGSGGLEPMYIASRVMRHMALKGQLPKFSSISSTIFMLVWIVIAVCSIRFHAAIRAQNSTIIEGRYAYKAMFWPIGPMFLGIAAFLVLVGLFAESLFPVGGTNFNAHDFFETYLGVPLTLAAWLGYKVILKTKIRKASEIDLVSGHRPLTAEDETFLDHYYSLPTGGECGVTSLPVSKISVGAEEAFILQRVAIILFISASWPLEFPIAQLSTNHKSSAKPEPQPSTPLYILTAPPE